MREMGVKVEGMQAAVEFVIVEDGSSSSSSIGGARCRWAAAAPGTNADAVGSRVHSASIDLPTFILKRTEQG